MSFIDHCDKMLLWSDASLGRSIYLRVECDPIKNIFFYINEKNYQKNKSYHGYTKFAERRIKDR